MSQTNYTRSGWKQALLVLVGIVIAVLLTVRSFSKPEAPEKAAPTSNAPDPAPATGENQVDKSDDSGAGPTINSSTRLLQFFTENLPYLNSK